MVYTHLFFSSNCSLFHNSNVFGSCVIQILYIECAKIKNNSGAKKLGYVSICYRLCPGLSSGLFNSDFQIKVFFMYFPCAMCAAYLIHLITLIALISSLEIRREC